MNLFINIFFLIFTLFVLGKLIGYSIYEIKNDRNIFGGFCIIVFSIFSVFFSNAVIWQM